MKRLPNPDLAPYQRAEFFRIIPSRFPPISLYEAIYDTPEELEIAYAIEALTNPRVLQELGDLSLVAPSERVTGPGALIVMAPFTHLSSQTRFSDGTFGVYYAAKSLETAIAETKYHRAYFLSQTNQPDQEIAMRVYSGKIKGRMLDIRPSVYAKLLNPSDYIDSQSFARVMRDGGAKGVLYSSVRHAVGYCVAVFRPTAVGIPKQRMPLKYVYSQSSQSIVQVYEAREL